MPLGQRPTGIRVATVLVAVSMRLTRASVGLVTSTRRPSGLIASRAASVATSGIVVTTPFVARSNTVTDTARRLST